MPRGKKKTTFEKLARESRLREKRLDKAARKEARKRAAENEAAPSAEMSGADEFDAPADEFDAPEDAGALTDGPPVAVSGSESTP